ncbi:hypothetical protein ERJ75_000215200 [Trypanosoma vivax]|nr:hypothetical protein ERJ75_000214800 [Trypanosoma vivax]KAH8619121.1 hypothetical protein ERJ75_000215200 [Trypanosoma vivax]
MRAARAFAEKYRRAFFSFAYRPRAAVGVAHADGFLRLENGELFLFFRNRQVKFMSLRSALVSFELPKTGNFIRTFEATKECFQNERRALGEGRSALPHQCEAVLQIHEERQSMQAHFAATDGENNGLKQWICQPQEQNQHMLDRAKSLQDVNGVLAAENGLLKTGRVHVAAEVRGASAQRGEASAQLQRQWARTFFHVPPSGERQQKQENNNPLATNVWFRGIQGLRDKLGEGSFRAGEKIRAYEGALGHLTATSPENLFAACRGMLPMLSKPCLLLQDAWGEMAIWAGTVGEMGLMDGLNRLGRCAYNRQRPVRAAGAHPGMQLDSAAVALKDP